MIKIDVRLPSRRDLTTQVTSELERLLTAKVRSASSGHGKVTIRFGRSTDGTIREVHLRGPSGAVEAATKALSK